MSQRSNLISAVSIFVSANAMAVSAVVFSEMSRTSFGEFGPLLATGLALLAVFGGSVAGYVFATH
jgi:hypothetical protein